MTQLSSDKYTIAWFKLAEFIARKEKERALGIYRLLAHSLHDEALSCQLEGDILLSFSDDKALGAYVKAAIIYEKQGHIIQAAALYEHLIMLAPSCIDYAYKLVQLYSTQACKAPLMRAITHLATVCAQLLRTTFNNNTYDQTEIYVQEIISALPDQYKALVYDYIACNLSVCTFSISETKKYAAQAVYFYTKLQDNNRLQAFMTKLLEANEHVYIYAQECSFENG